MAIDTNSSASDIINLNNQRYQVEIYLINSNLRFKVPTGIINELLITESLYSVFPTGVLSINNTGNVLENFVSDVSNELNEKIESSAYMFNSDGRDIFYISIKPVDINEALNTTFPDESWEIEGFFSIYDEEEVVNNAGGIKTKIFYIRDIREQLLMETTPQWSTILPLLEKFSSKINVSQISNELRSVETGLAIKHLLKTTLPYFVKEENFASDWNTGISKTFYTSTANDDAYDVLEYLLDQHISEHEDPCILLGERGGIISLRPLETYFKNAYDKRSNNIGSYVVDAFSVNVATTPKKEFTSNVVEQYNLPPGIVQQFDGLSNFSYLNTANSDSSLELRSVATHFYNFDKKEFNIISKDGHILTARQKFQELYTDNMPGTRPQTILPLNDNKIVNKTVENVFSPEQSRMNTLQDSKTKTLNKILSLAPSISFDVTGSTARRPGRFILMMVNNVDTNSSFGKIFPGEWLITTVNHVFLFSKNLYQNTVTCAKPFAINNILPDQVLNSYEDYYEESIR